MVPGTMQQCNMNTLLGFKRTHACKHVRMQAHMHAHTCMYAPTHTHNQICLQYVVHSCTNIYGTSPFRLLKPPLLISLQTVSCVTLQCLSKKHSYGQHPINPLLKHTSECGDSCFSTITHYSNLSLHVTWMCLQTHWQCSKRSWPDARQQKQGSYKYCSNTSLVTCSAYSIPLRTIPITQWLTFTRIYSWIETWIPISKEKRLQRFIIIIQRRIP